MPVAMSANTLRITASGWKLTRSVAFGRWGMRLRVPQLDQKMPTAMSTASVAAKGG